MWLNIRETVNKTFQNVALYDLTAGNLCVQQYFISFIVGFSHTSLAIMSNPNKYIYRKMFMCTTSAIDFNKWCCWHLIIFFSEHWQDIVSSLPFLFSIKINFVISTNQLFVIQNNCIFIDKLYFLYWKVKEVLFSFLTRNREFNLLGLHNQR